MTTPAYTAKDITVLEGLEPVRKRPSMYIGGTDTRGLHHLLWEIVDNAVDEHLAGHATAITVTLHKGRETASVIDDGRGIPVDIHPQHKRSALELILTTLHAGGKFDEKSGYVHSGGLHGVGSSVVNALAQELVATVWRDGNTYVQRYSRGKALGPVERQGAARRRGTWIRFTPDPDIFPGGTKLDPETVRARLDDLAYVHPGLTITFKDEDTDETRVFAHRGGLAEYIERVGKEGGRSPIADLVFSLSKPGDTRVELAMQWTDATAESLRSYVNGIRTASGGTHETGLKNAVAKAVRNYIDTHGINVKGLGLTAEDIREGLIAALSVFVRNPMFQGQTKDRLNNPETASTVEAAVRGPLEAWLNANKTAADRIVARIVTAARARLAARDAAKEVRRKSLVKSRVQLPGKLADCKSTKLDESEIFIVEGDSAGGSAKQGRDNKTQAVLPLRGKILNSEGLASAKALANSELSDLVTAIGTGAGDRFDVSRLRYGKVILLMDADADGHHITTLLLGFFFRHMRGLLDDGRVYIAQPPLYRIVIGQKTHWARDDREKGRVLAKLGDRADKADVTRFKGLGEMPPAVLAQTTLDVKSRRLLRVRVPELLEADGAMTLLLGKEVAPRYRFIVDSAATADAEELDV